MRILLAMVLSAATLAAQSFEVATIKPNNTDAPGVGGLGFTFDGIRARNQAPADLIRMAFGFQKDQVVGAPSWAATERFDIVAKLAPGVMFNPTTMFKPTVQKLLETRFQLRVHHEMRELNVYRLVRLRADSLGPKLAQSTDGCEPPPQSDAAALKAFRGCSAGAIPGGLNVRGMPLETLTNFLASSAGRVIVDATGLAGNWDLELTFVNPAENANADGPSLFTAVEEQLGLKLESARVPVDVIVIDRLERPSAD